MRIGRPIRTLGRTVSFLVLFLSGCATPFPYSGEVDSLNDKSAESLRYGYFKTYDDGHKRFTVGGAYGPIKPFRVSPTNKYAIIIEGRQFKLAVKEPPCDEYGFV